MAETRSTNPLVEQFQKGGVPRELRLLGAQGALPLKPEDLVDLLHFLTTDDDDGVRTAARASLQAMPVAELLPVAKDRLTPGAVLAWVLAHRTERELLEPVLQNTSLPDEAVQARAATLGAELAELVVINQVRLLRSTPLLEALESNPGLNNDQRRRLRELRETFKIGAPSAAPPAPAPAPEPEPVPVPVPVEVVEQAVAAEEPEAITEEEAVARYLAEDERQDQDKVSVIQKIYKMNTAQKIIAALKGSRDERTILIRDPNRLVATAVLGSPRLTEAEVENFAAMKNISDEVLRKIGNHRDWTKKYTVVSALVKNPRTPVGISMTLIPRLNPKDIKGLAIDRNVSEVVRKTAQRFVKQAQDKKPS